MQGLKSTGLGAEPCSTGLGAEPCSPNPRLSSCKYLIFVRQCLILRSSGLGLGRKGKREREGTSRTQSAGTRASTVKKSQSWTVLSKPQRGALWGSEGRGSSRRRRRRRRRRKDYSNKCSEGGTILDLSLVPPFLIFPLHPPPFLPRAATWASIRQ